MPLTLSPATPPDIPAIVSVLFTAFIPDPLFMKCYPNTPSNQDFWVRTIESQLQGSPTKVMKVVDDETGEIIAFGKWLVHRNDDASAAAKSGAVNPAAGTASPDMDMETCKNLANAQYKMRKELMGDRAHYWLNALATLPKYQRRGAATMLVKWGAEQADRDGVECFTASTDTARGNVKRILEREGHELKGYEVVVPAEDLGVHGSVRPIGGRA